jgi:hypothetical protein
MGDEVGLQEPHFSYYSLQLFKTLVPELYSEVAISRKPFGMGHMYIHTYTLLRLTNTVTAARPFLLGDPAYFSVPTVCRRMLFCRQFSRNCLHGTEQLKGSQLIMQF